MSRFARVLLVAFLAAFATGTAATASAATDMSLKMSMSGMDDSMADCQDCPDGSQASVCDQFCVTTLAAICPPAGIDLPNVANIVAIRIARSPGGHAGPPDPYPPRSIL